MSFIIPSDELVCIALFKKARHIDDIKAFYQTILRCPFTYTNRVILSVHDHGDLLAKRDPERNFVLGFSDLATFMLLKLAYPDLIIDVWYKKVDS